MIGAAPTATSKDANARACRLNAPLSSIFLHNSTGRWQLLITSFSLAYFRRGRRSAFKPSIASATYFGMGSSPNSYRVIVFRAMPSRFASAC
jgi:hypothetical protein